MGSTGTHTYRDAARDAGAPEAEVASSAPLHLYHLLLSFFFWLRIVLLCFSSSVHGPLAAFARLLFWGPVSPGVSPLPGSRFSGEALFTRHSGQSGEYCAPKRHENRSQAEARLQDIQDIGSLSLNKRLKTRTRTKSRLRLDALPLHCERIYRHKSAINRLSSSISK